MQSEIKPNVSVFIETYMYISALADGHVINRKGLKTLLYNFFVCLNGYECTVQSTK